jgi:RimJ/RimL family protein N-acetyltransferase
MQSMPSLEPHEPTPFDEWAAFVLGRPLYQPEGSFVALADGEPAAISFLTADLESGRGTNMYTGTLPEFRGRGLALAAKLGVLHWAAENGVTQVGTVNDETNAPMLAINGRLGYVPAGRRVEFSRSAD